jgi:hypothetical protein
MSGNSGWEVGINTKNNTAAEVKNIREKREEH